MDPELVLGFTDECVCPPKATSVGEDGQVH
jgi:hypothetical protein